MAHQGAHPHPGAFDEVAAGYDEAFSATQLARLLRPRVWRRLAQCFAPGQVVLELACGTGEDALWLARRGVHVVATDASAEMIRIVSNKARAANLESRVQPRQLAFDDLADETRKSTGEDGEPGAIPQSIAGAYSNFGGLNTIGNWRPLAEGMARRILPGGHVVLVLMGPWCPWEMAWYALHGRLSLAFRRFRKKAEARIGDSIIPVWYPSAGRLRHAFSPWFRQQSLESLGLWLPPSYLNHLLNRWPRLFRWLEKLERRTARWSGGWGDHYLMVLERTEA